MQIHRSIRLSLGAFLAAALLCAFIAVARPAAAQQPYHVIDTWKLGGDGGWDYLLADPRRTGFTSRTALALKSSTLPRASP